MRTLLIVCVIPLFSGIAFAQPSNSSKTSQPQTENARKDDRNCIRHTGSRIKSEDRCLPVAGRSYSKDDLDRTGAINVSDAIRQLDPALSERTVSP